MLQIKTDSASNIIYTTVAGTLVKEEIENIMAAVNAKIKSFGKARWYYEMHDFHGWKVDAFLKDFKFSISHRDDFEKIALVGEEGWQKVMTQLMKPFTSAAVKYFSVAERAIAKEWIQS